MPKPTASFDDVTCTRETEKAILCVVDGEDCWIPKSVVDDDSEVFGEGDKGTLIIHEWFAIQEGLV